jgi:ATP-dependent DNA ligase
MTQWQRWKNVMKAYPFEEKRLMKWQPPFIVQPKYDGFRCRAVPLSNIEQRGYLLLSSEENVFYSVPHINNSLLNFQGPELDGELYCHGMSFDELSSIVSRTTNLHPDHEQVKFHVFDMVTEQPQGMRTLMVEDLNCKLPHVITAPYHICWTLDDIMKVYDNFLEQGYEGIIVRNVNAPYERKRSTQVMKFKPKKEDIYRIRWFKEEISINGVPKGQLGSLVCESGDGETFDVGSGFTDEQRQELWKDKINLVGKSVRVSYQHLTSRRKVPRFPVFMEVIENE